MATPPQMTTPGATSMPRKLPPHVDRNRVKGRDYYSFRIGKGQRIPLPNDPNSERFKEAYRAALAGEYKPERKRIVTSAPGTVGALIASYMQSDRFLSLKDTTKTGYLSRLEILRTANGHRTVAGLSRERIEGMLVPYIGRPGQKLALL